MLTVSGISKSYGILNVLSNINFSLNHGDRLGLIGLNGCGKSTLLRIIVGEENSDTGVIRLLPTNLRIGYLPQGFHFGASDTIGSVVSNSHSNLDQLSSDLALAGQELADDLANVGKQEKYDRLLSEINLLMETANRSGSILSALGLDYLSPDMPAEMLSGGQKTRLALAMVLLSTPQLLILDEPTNHLDLEMLDWLQDWLNSFRGGLLVVSHDRAFLDGTCTGILELDQDTHQIKVYPGNYSAYLEQKAAEKDRQWQEFTDQQQEIRRLRLAAQHMRGLAKMRKGGKADSGDKFAKGFFGNRAKMSVGRAKHLETRIDRLMTEDKVDKPRLTWEMKMDFTEVEPSGRDVVTLEGLSIGYDENILLANINQSARFGQRIALIGPNGAGKSTLLKTIQSHIPAISGQVRLGSRVSIGYMAQEQENLDPGLSPLATIAQNATLNETELRAFLSLYLFKGDDVFTPVSSLSYGERSRLILAALVSKGCNFLLLDEPINHLDIPSRARFEQCLTNFTGTILTSTHDRYFIASFATHIWEIHNGTIVSYPTS